MNILKKTIFLLIIFSISCTVKHSSDKLYLKDVFNKPLGTAVGYEFLLNDTAYRNILVSEFNSITPENAQKMEVILTSPDTYNFTKADYLADFAKKNNMRFRGHPLIWHRQIPEWLFAKDPGEINKIFKEYIETTVSHFRGRADSWDVVNEAFLKDGSYRESVWYKAAGKQYIENAFRIARATDPKAKLFYNDHNIESKNAKFFAVYKMLSEMISRKVPVDGIGIQAHIKSGDNLSELKEVMHEFAKLGLDVEITELDIALPLDAEAEQYKAQTADYVKIFKNCNDLKICKGLTLWGISDKNSWIESELRGYGHAALFDKEYRRKSFYIEIFNSLSISDSGR